MADWGIDAFACLVLTTSVFMLVRNHRRNRECPCPDKASLRRWSAAADATAKHSGGT